MIGKKLLGKSSCQCFKVIHFVNFLHLGEVSFVRTLACALINAGRGNLIKVHT
jgi:hypothetical protein